MVRGLKRFSPVNVVSVVCPVTLVFYIRSFARGKMYSAGFMQQMEGTNGSNVTDQDMSS